MLREGVGGEQPTEREENIQADTEVGLSGKEDVLNKETVENSKPEKHIGNFNSSENARAELEIDLLINPETLKDQESYCKKASEVLANAAFEKARKK